MFVLNTIMVGKCVKISIYLSFLFLCKSIKGALPWWLLSNGTDSIRPRTKEYNYMSAVKRWFSVLLPKIKPHLYKNGGKIITVQVMPIFFSLKSLFFIYPSIQTTNDLPKTLKISYKKLTHLAR